MDPLYGLAAFWRAVLAYATGDQDEGHRLYEAFWMRWPSEEVLGATELNALFWHANWEGFERVAAQLRARGVRDAATRAMLSMSDLRAPTPEVLRRMLDRLAGSIDRTGTANIFDLWIAYSVGLKDETFALIEQASFAHLFDPRGAPPAGTQRLGFLFIAETDRHMARDQRFVRLCHKMGLCDYWVKTERWPDCADQVDYDFRAEARRLVAV